MIHLGRITFTLVVGLTWISVEAGFAPPLPSGRRTQYYYRYDDGGYKYGYDTGKGSYSKAIASPDNEVQGDYAYEGPGGKIDVKYTAGKAGFLPDGLPSQGGAQHIGGVSSPSFYGDHHAASHHFDQQQHQELSDEEGPGDASYSFGFNAEDQSRQEVSDAGGNIQGSYTYVAKDGATRKVEYEAGAEKGFIIKGSLPGAYSSIPSEAVSNPDGSYSFSYTAGDHSRHESTDANGNVVGSFSFIAKDDGQNRQVNYEAGAERGFIASGSHLPQPVQPTSSVSGGHFSHGHGVETAKIHGGYTGVPAAVHYSGASATHSIAHSTGSSAIAGPAPERAYSFSYNAGDHSRQETSDANGNVAGSFSFVAKDDQINRKVDYTATANQGFIAHGSHLPVPPMDVNAAAIHSTHSIGQTQHIHHGAIPHQPFVHSPAAHQFQYDAIPPHHTGGIAPDGSYSFSYNAGDHSRTESSDAKGNVVGSFTFIAKDDAVQRQLDYEAGAEKGFIARGSHLPQQVSSTTLGGSTAYSGHLSGTGVAPFVNTAFGGASHSHFAHGTSGPLIKTTHPAVAPYSPVYTTSTDGTGEVSDGSYSFDYNAGDHSRHETSDAAGNIVGSYTFKSKDDGVERKVDYEAGTKGFIASGAHLPLQPHVVAPEILISKPGDDVTVDYDTDGPSDASYSFSYNAGDHTRQESSDALGNVVGSFSFVAKDDGINRQVDYESGAEKGFIARGSHLPQPISSTGNPFAYSSVQPISHHHSGIHGGSAGTYFHAANTEAGQIASTYSTTSPAGSYTGSYEDAKAVIKTFLTPNAHHKFGYIYDTQ